MVESPFGPTTLDLLRLAQSEGLESQIEKERNKIASPSLSGRQQKPMLRRVLASVAKTDQPSACIKLLDYIAACLVLRKAKSTVSSVYQTIDWSLVVDHQQSSTERWMA